MYTNQNDDFSVDLSTVSENSLLPAGDYAIHCVSIELKPTKDGQGQYIAAQFEVLSGEYAKRRIFQNFNIKNKNQQAVEIALRSIKQWVKACGGTGNEQLTMRMLNGLQGKEVFAAVGISKLKDGYEQQNVINKFHYQPANAAPGAVPGVPSVAGYRAPAQPAQAAKNPWEK